MVISRSMRLRSSRPQTFAGARVSIYGCSLGCLLLSLAVSILLTIVLNVLIRLF
jgi:hypothetical protein